jgi:hypothetical protein
MTMFLGSAIMHAKLMQIIRINKAKMLDFQVFSQKRQAAGLSYNQAALIYRYPLKPAG